MRIEHTLSQQLLKRRAVQVLVFGAGGTGSAVLLGLPYLHQAMRVWGHPYGLAVTIMDPHIVSATNLRPPTFCAIRYRNEQSYRPAEPDQPVLGNLMGGFTKRVHRTVASWVRPDSRPCHRVCGYARSAEIHPRRADIALTANELLAGHRQQRGKWPVCFGQPLNMANRRNAERLRTVAELYPEIVDADAGEDELPSCSAVEALSRQELRKDRPSRRIL
jgi:hypothetical protein